MNITNTMTIRNLQDSFSKQFPGLKIELYSEKHGAYQSSSPEFQFQSATTLQEVNSEIEASEFKIDPTWTVEQFEELFAEKYSFNIQVFRKSNNVWLQTSNTDAWTLEVQNRKGLNSIQ